MPQPAGTTPSPEPNTPESITISALGVSAPVDPILATAGELLPPDDPSRVGWWQASALAGADSGTVVLIGHVDSVRFGPGALFGVTRLKAGDPLSVVTDSGRVDYRVTSRRTIPKAGGLPAGLFAVAGPPALVIITCGGPFDARTRHYRDNVVITATPSAAAGPTRP